MGKACGSETEIRLGLAVVVVHLPLYRAGSQLHRHRISFIGGFEMDAAPRHVIGTRAFSPARARSTMWSHSRGRSRWVSRVSLISLDRMRRVDPGDNRA